MTDGYSITTIAGREYKIGAAAPTPLNYYIRGNDNRPLLTLKADGTVEGEIEDASEAARLFVESLRGYFPQTTQSDVLRDLLEQARDRIDEMERNCGSNYEDDYTPEEGTLLGRIDAALQEQSK
jgi:hypothetical protein